MANNEKDLKMHVFTWKIEKFSMCFKKRGEIILSPNFKAKCFDETDWRLKFYPCGENESRDGFVSLHLNRKEGVSVPFEELYDISLEIIGKSGRIVQSYHCKQNFEKFSSWGWRNYMKKDELMKTCLHNDDLFIQCRLSRNVPTNICLSHNTSSTKIKTINHSFQWAVNNLDSATHQEVIKLLNIGLSQVEITIKIPEDDVKICIRTDENFYGSQLMSSKFILLDVEGKERDSRLATHIFDNAETWEFPAFIKKSQLNAHKNLYIQDSCFILQCDITVSDGSIVEATEKNEDVPHADKLTVSAVDTVAAMNEDIKRMYEDKIHTDIKLIVGKEVFPAHKSILCARSPVFLAMFDNDMAERQKGEVHIPDLDAKTVEYFLEYIYTGTANDLDYENIMKLILAADKYQVLSLKNKCAELLSLTLTDSNVCEILVTADLVQHSKLKVSVVDYIKKQPDKILNSEKWKLYAKNNLQLATEIFCEITSFWGNLTKGQSGK